MEKDPHVLDSLIEKIENYGKTNIELIQLRSIKKVAKFAAFLYVNIILLIILILCILLLNVGLSIWVGTIFGEMYLGFLFVAAVYAVLGLFYFLFGFKYQKAKFEYRIITFLVN
jgi:hypothetical protein